MPKKRQEPIFLNVYKDKEGKETFQPYRLEKMENGMTMGLPNERSLDENGNPKRRAMNRAARRILPSWKERRKLING